MSYLEGDNILDLDANDFVTKIAALIYSKRFDDSIAFEDYKQLGLLGYLEAKEKFNPTLGVSFKTFAAYRIKGSILSGISKYTERINYFIHKKKSISQKIKRTTSQPPEIKFNDFANMVVELLLEEMLDMLFESLIFDSDENDNIIDKSKVAKTLLKAVDKLPNLQKQVIVYHYFSDFSFHSTASILGLSKGRVSQLHKLALEALFIEVSRQGDFSANL